MALQPIRLTRLTGSLQIVDDRGRSATPFQTYFNNSLQTIEQTFNGVIAAQNAADAAQVTADGAQISASAASVAAGNAVTTANGAQTIASNANTAAANAQATADSKIDQATADGRYVRKSVTVSWSTPTGPLDRSTFSTYAAPTISNPPTQTEVQNVANAVQVVSQHLAALISDLRTNGTLS